MTRVILLVILVCQFFTLTQAFSVQYPSGLHPMGINIDHHHSHKHTYQPHITQSKQTFYRQHAQENNKTSHALSSSQANHQDTSLNGSGSTENLEHEHTHHTHTPSHPLLDALFTNPFFQSGTLCDEDIAYQNHFYAPPLPPPHGNLKRY